jgi:peptide/nickel transport system substrate-binding protein
MPAVAKNFDTYGLGNKELKHPVSEVITNYKASEVIDPLTVKFTFTKPSVGFLQGTSSSARAWCRSRRWRCPTSAGRRHQDHRLGAVRGGERSAGPRARATARKDYKWARGVDHSSHLANLDGIKYVVTPEDSVRIGALLAGQAQVIRQVQAYDEKQVQSKNFLIYAPPTRGVNNSVVFRPDNALVSDLKVRQALLHGTNAKEIVATLFSANYPQARSIIASTAQGYIDLSAKLTYDPALAARLLTRRAGQWVPACARRTARSWC